MQSTTKKDLAIRISRSTYVEPTTIIEIINCLEDEIKSDIQYGKMVTLRKFGTFLPTLQKAKMGRNINTGEPIFIEGKMVPKFKPSKLFIDQLSE